MVWRQLEETDDDRSVTEWLDVPGGRIYRSVWDRDPQEERATLRGSSMVFVPAPRPYSADAQQVAQEQIRVAWEDR